MPHPRSAQSATQRGMLGLMGTHHTVPAVLFDYYFTLAEVRPRTLGCDATIEAIDAALGRRREWSPPPPPACFDGEPPAFLAFRDIWQDFGEALFLQLGVAGGGSANVAARSLAHQEAELYPDVLPTLEALRAAGMKIGVVSDADADYLDANIARHGLSFDVGISSEALGCYKPHRAMWEAACRALDVEPGEAVFVGDTPVNDIEGSRRAGLRPIWINRRNLEWPFDLEPPTTVIGSLLELPPAVLSPAH